MESRPSRSAGWMAFSAAVLIVGGIFGIIDGLVAVYKSTFFTANAVFVFSSLHTWGWITFGLGIAALASGLAVYTGREWARWLGVLVASVMVIEQLLFAQAYPLWSLMMVGIFGLVVYGLIAHGGWREESAASRSARDTTAGGTSQPTSISEADRERRAA